jgi:hypothetical protein
MRKKHLKAATLICRIDVTAFAGVMFALVAMFLLPATVIIDFRGAIASEKVPTIARRFAWALFPPQLIEIDHKSIRPHRSEMKNLSPYASGHEGRTQLFYVPFHQ